MSLLIVFSANLRRYIQKRSLSQEAFASLAGLHRTYISALVCEKRSVALDNIEKIAIALDVYLLFIYKDNTTCSIQKMRINGDVEDE